MARVYAKLNEFWLNQHGIDRELLPNTFMLVLKDGVNLGTLTQKTMIGVVRIDQLNGTKLQLDFDGSFVEIFPAQTPVEWPVPPECCGFDHERGTACPKTPW